MSFSLIFILYCCHLTLWFGKLLVNSYPRFDLYLGGFWLAYVEWRKWKPRWRWNELGCILSILSITLLLRFTCDSFDFLATVSFIWEAAAARSRRLYNGVATGFKRRARRRQTGPLASLKFAFFRSFFQETIVVSLGFSSTLNRTRPPPTSTDGPCFGSGPFSGRADLASFTINFVLFQ